MKSVDRVERLREQIQSLSDGGVRISSRESIIRDSLAKTESEPWPIRRAMAFQDILETAELIVLDGEPFVGSIHGLFPPLADPPSLDVLRKEAIEHLRKKNAAKENIPYGRSLTEHDYDVYSGGCIGFEDLKALANSLAEEFEGDWAYDRAQIFSELQRLFSRQPQVFGPLQDFFRDREKQDGPLWTFFNHMAVDYGKVLRRGHADILREIEERLGAASGDQKIFYQAAAISIMAAMAFVSRYAQNLREAAKEEPCEDRRNELRYIAERLRKLSAAPAESFCDAVQLFWLTHIVLSMAGGIALTAGRFDQYVYPFLKRDLEQKRIDRETALEWLACLWLKFNEPKLAAVQNLTIGGLTLEGTEGTNDLSFLCLEAAALARMPYPNLSARIHRDTSEEFFLAAAETLRAGTGNPALYNDDILIPALCDAGFDLEDARDYCVMGCQEIVVPLRQPPWELSHGVNFPRVVGSTLEAAANNGGFAAFGDFVESCKAQIGAEIEHVVAHTGKKFKELFKIGADPFGSALLDGCLESGRDMYQRGTKYPASIGFWGVGLASAADALAAVRRLLFEDREMTLKELAEILERDFENAEPFRQFLLNKTVKYGNDKDETDLVAKEIGEHFCRETLKHCGPHGEFMLPLLASYVNHVHAGEGAGATPDGRKRGDPVSDALSAAQGMDRNGPTAALRSALKLDHQLAPGGVALNIKFSKKTIEGKEGARNLCALLKTYFHGGGQQIQINIVNRETLEEAKEHPKRHRNLAVRVAGFSETFVKLDAKLQDEIIARTEY